MAPMVIRAMPVESKIRNNVTEFVAVQLGEKLPEVRNHLRGGRYEIESGVLCPDVIEQEVRVNDDARAVQTCIELGAVYTCVVVYAVPACADTRSADVPSIRAFEHPAQSIALRVGKVFLANQ